MKLYKITFKDNRQTFLELKEGTAEELLQHINPAEIKSLELVFEGQPEETFFERVKLYGMFEKELESIETICKTALKTLEDMKDPLEPARIMDLLTQHFKTLEDIYEKYTEILIFENQSIKEVA
ncbi:hypothetical protein [Persephonella sp.]